MPTFTRWLAVLGVILASLVSSSSQDEGVYGDPGDPIQRTAYGGKLMNERRILDTILDGYDKRFPVPEVVVELEIDLLELNVLNNSYLNKINLNFYTHLRWSDFRLTWNPSDFGEMNEITVRGTDVDIWKPDIGIYNSIHPILKDDEETDDIVIRHNGVVTLTRSTRHVISCVNPPLNLKETPRKTQRCDLYFASYGYSKEELDLKCERPIKLDYFRDIWDYQVLRPERPTTTTQTFGARVYAKCVYEIAFRLKDTASIPTGSKNPENDDSKK